MLVMEDIDGEFGESVGLAVSSVSGVAFSHWVKQKIGNNKNHRPVPRYLPLRPDTMQPAASDRGPNLTDLTSEFAIRLKLVLSVWLELCRPPYPSATIRDIVSPFTQPPILHDYNISDQQFVQMNWYSLVMVVLPPRQIQEPLSTSVAGSSYNKSVPVRKCSTSFLFDNVEALEMPRDCVGYLSTMIGLVYIPSIYSMLTFFHPISGKPMPRLLCQEGRVYDIYGIPLDSLSYDVGKQMLKHTVATRAPTFDNNYQTCGLNGEITNSSDNGLQTSIITAPSVTEAGVLSRPARGRLSRCNATSTRQQTIVRQYPVPQINCTNTSRFDCESVVSLLEQTVSCSWMYGNAAEPLRLSPRAKNVADAVARAFGLRVPSKNRLPCGIPHELLGDMFPDAKNIEIRGQTKPVNETNQPLIFATSVSGLATDTLSLSPTLEPAA